MSNNKNTEDDFWRRVSIVTDDECWIWLGKPKMNGYGDMVLNGKHELVHRISWILHFGDIPNNLWVLHHCDNKLCVNPKHLFLGTIIDNDIDRHNKGREAKGESHGMSKFTNADVLMIRKLRGDGYTLAEIGNMFGSNKGQISKICLHRLWTHI
jgi:hypothetical protein